MPANQPKLTTDSLPSPEEKLKVLKKERASLLRQKPLDVLLSSVTTYFGLSGLFFLVYYGLFNRPQENFELVMLWTAMFLFFAAGAFFWRRARLAKTASTDVARLKNLDEKIHKLEREMEHKKHIAR